MIVISPDPFILFLSARTSVFLAPSSIFVRHEHQQDTDTRHEVSRVSGLSRAHLDGWWVKFNYRRPCASAPRHSHASRYSGLTDFDNHFNVAVYAEKEKNGNNKKHFYIFFYIRLFSFSIALCLTTYFVYFCEAFHNTRAHKLSAGRFQNDFYKCKIETDPLFIIRFYIIRVLFVEHCGVITWYSNN